MNKNVKDSSVNIVVKFDEERIPIDIELSGSDFPKTEPIKAMLLSFFNLDHRETVKIDLWTKDMQVIEMDRFMYQTLSALSKTYLSATNNKDLASDMRRFAEYFGQKTEIIPSDNPDKNV